MLGFSLVWFGRCRAEWSSVFRPCLWSRPAALSRDRGDRGRRVSRVGMVVSGAEMNIERIDEPIRVVASFSKGEVRPLRFRWGGRDYPVSRINARWTDRDADAPRLHFSAQVGEETYYLHFDTAELTWRLDQLVVA